MTDAIEVMERPIVYRPFMGNADITLTPNMVLKFLARPTRSGQMPKLADVVRFGKLCEARGLNPWEGDAYLVGFDSQDGPEFNLITAHQAFIKRAEVHPEFDGMASGVTVRLKDGTIADVEGDFVDDGQTLVGGWARVHFKQRKIPTYRRLNLKTFSTGRSRWSKDPAGMIVKCAEADALRSSFPTKLGGLYLREEFDASVQVVEGEVVNQKPDLAERLKALPEKNGNGHKEEPPVETPEQPQESPRPEAAEPTGFEKFKIELYELAQGLGCTEEEFNTTVGRWILALKLKGKEEQTTPDQRSKMADALASKAGVWAFLNRS